MLRLVFKEEQRLDVCVASHRTPRLVCVSHGSEICYQYEQQDVEVCDRTVRDVEREQRR